MNTQPIFLKSNSYNIVKNDITYNNLHHAYMLINIDGVKLKLFAKHIAQMLLCTNTVVPCQTCVNCKRVLSQTYSDVLFFPAKDKLTVEESRKIISESYVIPIESNYKIFIINNIDKATLQAQNALLKTLEDAQKICVFIMTCQNENNVAKTITSRVKKIYERLLTDEELTNLLAISFDKNKVQQIVCNSDGSLQQALRYLENNNIITLLELCFDMFINMKNSSQVLRYVSKFLKYKTDYETILQLLNLVIRDATIAHVNPYFIKNRKWIKGLNSVIHEYPINALELISSAINQANKKLSINCNPTMIFEHLLMHILEVKFLCKK